MTTITDDDEKVILQTVQSKLAERAKKTGIELTVSSEESRREDG